MRTIESSEITGAVTEVRHALDTDALARYLVGKLDGVERGLRVRQFEGGQSNPTFLLETERDAWVLRKKPSGELLRSAHLVEREWQVLRALAGSAVPVPAVPVACADPSVIGTPFFIMAYARGRIERDPRLAHRPVDERRASYAHAIATLAALHQVDYAARGLASFGRPADYLARQIARWTQQYAQAHVARLPSLEWLAEHLAAHIPPPSTPALIHGDYRLDNVVLAADGPEVVAVLDWELSTLGEPLADLAHFLIPLHLRDVPGVPASDDLVARYAQARAIAAPAPEVMRFYLGFAMFRYAAILVGVGRRARAGNASSAHAVQTAAQAGLFADRGRQIIEDRP